MPKIKCRAAKLGSLNRVELLRRGLALKLVVTALSTIGINAVNNEPVLAQTPPALMQYYQQLAFRFRPFLKTSLDGNGNVETDRPAGWSWVLNQPIEMVQVYKSTTDPGCAGHGTGDKWPQGQEVVPISGGEG
jgi:hypothetical protein